VLAAIHHGYEVLIQIILDLLVAYPYGMLADRIGRKPVLLMSFGGLAVSFLLAPFMLLSSWRQIIRDNPYIMITGPIFTLFGGGVPVLLATLYSVASDASTDETK
jgi:MFS transporter, PCFT/HCP family, solute carrier family 46 (folate transporter), member 1